MSLREVLGRSTIIVLALACGGLLARSLGIEWPEVAGWYVGLATGLVVGAAAYG